MADLLPHGNYELRGWHDLEDFLDQHVDDSALNRDDQSEAERRVLYKVFLKPTWRESILSELELVAISGGHLYGSADGVAQDVKNTYFYNPKGTVLRGVSFPPPTL